jgi:hypothetical protein
MSRRQPDPPRWRLGSASIIVLLVGLLATVLLAVLAALSYDHSEQRLTTLEARLSGLALSGAASDIQLQLAPAAHVAAEGGNPAAIQRALPPVAPQGLAGTAVFEVQGSNIKLVQSAGKALALQALPQGARLIQEAATSGSLAVVREGSGDAQQLIYALGARGAAGTFVASAQQPLPGGRRVKVDPTNPAGNLNFALYFGRSEAPSALLETNAAHLPIGGTHASTTVPFGNASITLVISARDSLAGGIAEYSPWIIVVVGLLFTLAVAILLERTARGRRRAETLAVENQRLFEDQRGVAERFQHALLPKSLPDTPRLGVAVRYLTGTAGMDVGGDWYDVIAVDSRRAFFTVGDVAGRGLDAAILMGSLRSAINAYAAEGDPPEEVLSKLGRLVDLPADGRFATVICGRIDLATGEATLANAGHPPPLLVHDGVAEVVHIAPGPPIGIGRTYGSISVKVPPGATLLAYTDGLIERPAETISSGTDRLRRAAATGGQLDQMLERVLNELVPDGRSEDDVALLGMRWNP